MLVADAGIVIKLLVRIHRIVINMTTSNSSKSVTIPVLRVFELCSSDMGFYMYLSVFSQEVILTQRDKKGDTVFV